MSLQFVDLNEKQIWSLNTNYYLLFYGYLLMQNILCITIVHPTNVN